MYLKINISKLKKYHDFPNTSFDFEMRKIWIKSILLYVTDIDKHLEVQLLKLIKISVSHSNFRGFCKTTSERFLIMLSAWFNVFVG